MDTDVLDPTKEQEAPPEPGKMSFMDRVMDLTTEKPEPTAPKVEEKPPVEQPKKGVPDQLFKKEEAAKVEEKKDESEFDKIPDPDFKDPKRKADWDGIKARGKTFEQQAKDNAAKAAALEARIAEAEAKGKSTEELQEKLSKLEQQNAEWSELVTKANVEAHPEYRKKYVDGRNDLIGKAQQLIRDNDGDADAIATALNLKGKPRIDALRSIADDLPGFQQGQLGQIIEKLDILDTEAAEKRSKSGEYWKELQAQEQAKSQAQKAEYETTINKTFDKVRSAITKDLEVMNPVEGFEEWSKRVPELHQKAEELFKQNTDHEVAARAAYQAVTQPVYRELYLGEREANTKLTSEVEKMKAELAKIYSGNPGGMSPGGSTDKTVKQMGFLERIAHETAQQ